LLVDMLFRLKIAAVDPSPIACYAAQTPEKALRTNSATSDNNQLINIQLSEWQPAVKICSDNKPSGCRCRLPSFGGPTSADLVSEHIAG
jgi:hypothetical protein